MAGLDYDAMTEDALAAAEAREFWTERMRRGVQPFSGREHGMLGRLGEAVGGFVGDLATSYQDLFNRAKEEATSAAFGGSYNPQPVAELTLNIGAGGMPMTAKGAANTLGMFGGRLSPIADREALVKAQLMAARGIPREEIIQKTGWFQGPDGAWRFEIPDIPSSFREPNIIELRGLKGLTEKWEKDPHAPREMLPPIGKYFKHRGVERAYPGMLQDIKFGLENDPRFAASFNPGHRVIRYNPIDVDPKSSLLHELQHAIQQREGFAKGSFPGNPATKDIVEQATPRFQQIAADFVDAYNRDRDAFVKMYQDTAGGDLWEAAQAWVAKNPQRARDYDAARKLMLGEAARGSAASMAYKRTAGETEARNVQTRAPFTLEQRRQVYPWETADYPDWGQIVIPYEQSVLPF